jgi:hypothetical protein
MIKILKNKKFLILILLLLIFFITLFFIFNEKKYSEINDCKKTELVDSIREHRLCQFVNLKNLNIEEKKAKIGDILKEKINKAFNTSDYVIDVSQMESDEKVTKIYDLIFAISGAKTNIGYTVFVNGDDSIIESVFDNMEGYKTLELKKRYGSIIKTKIDNLSESRIENMRKKAIEISDGTNYTKTIISEGFRYDIVKSKLYYSILYEGKDIIEGETNLDPPKWADVYEEEI